MCFQEIKLAEACIRDFVAKYESSSSLNVLVQAQAKLYMLIKLGQKKNKKMPTKLEDYCLFSLKVIRIGQSLLHTCNILTYSFNKYVAFYFSDHPT